MVAMPGLRYSAVGATQLENGAGASKFTLAVLPDRSGNIRPGVFRRIAAQVELMHPDFAVFIGDAIEITGASTPEEEEVALLHVEWDGFFDELAPLTRPVYFVPGWHDYKSPLHALVYHHRLGADFYSWDYRGCHFIALNCYDAFVKGEAPRSAVWRVGETQMQWLAADVRASSSAAHTVLFVHAFYESMERSEICGLLADRSHTIISGSSHAYRKTSCGGCTYYVVGTAGGYSPLDGPEDGTVDHFLWMTIEDGIPHIANVLIDSVLADDFCTE